MHDGGGRLSGATSGDAARTSVPLPGNRATMGMKTRGWVDGAKVGD